MGARQIACRSFIADSSLGKVSTGILRVTGSMQENEAHVDEEEAHRDAEDIQSSAYRTAVACRIIQFQSRLVLSSLPPTPGRGESSSRELKKRYEWVLSDGVLRTHHEMFCALPFRWRGAPMEAALRQTIGSCGKGGPA